MASKNFDASVNLNTKKIIFEEVFEALDSGLLEQLKELSSKRSALWGFLRRSTSLTDAIAREMSGGLRSHSEQDVHKFEQYLPLLHNLVYHVGLAGGNSSTARRLLNLKIRWTSGLNSSSSLSLCGTKFFQINSLQFEVSMTLSLYGALLRQRALEVISVDLVQSATLYRRAAGVYDYLATVVNPNLHMIKPSDKPPESSSSVSSVMRLICLSEAQAVTIKKAEEKGNSGGLLAKLYGGAAQLLDEASPILKAAEKEHKDISSRLSDYISFNKALYELKSEKCLAESHVKDVDDANMGVAIGILIRGLANARKKIMGAKEINEVALLLKKYERENDVVWHQKAPLPHELPTSEVTILVKHCAYEPARWEREIAFKA